MKTVENSSRRGLSPGGRLFVPLVAGVVAAAIGLLALLGWYLNHPLLASFGTDLIPMAPSTAALLVLYGAAVCLRVRQPAGRRAFQAGLAMVGLGTVAALLLFALASLNIHWGIEHPGLNITQTAGKMVIGHMSPASALCFIFVSLSYLASLSPVAIPFWRSVLALGAAGLLLGTCFVFLLAYIFGAPLLYGGAFIPPALNSVLAFALLGLGLLALAGRPAGLWHGSPAKGYRNVVVFVLVFALLAVGIVTAGYHYYRNYEQNFRSEAEKELTAIADLKASDLVQYRKERLEDGAILFGNENISGLVRRFFGNPADADAQRQLQVWSEKFRSQGDYDVVRLLDAQGVARLSLPAGIPPVSSDVLRRIPEILQTGQVTFQDFHRNENDHRVYLDILVPIFDPQDAGRPLGIFYLRINPETYLYPFIKRWPVPSATAETLLVRREGTNVVFLNELRFQTNTALNLRIPLTTPDNNAVKAVLGQTGIVESRDYYGSLVISDVRAVPNSPWFLVARVDGREFFAPMRERLWQTIFTLVILLLGAGAGAGLLWRQQSVRFYREKSESQAERARLGAIVESSHDAIIGKDLDGIITSWNLGAEKIYGYGTAEAVGKSITMLIPPEKQDEFARLMEKIKRGEPVVNHDAERIRKDGGRIQVSLTLSPVKDAAGKIVGASVIGCDITEQKRMEAALNYERNLWQTLLDTVPDKIYFKDAQSRFIKCSQSQARDFGKKSPDEMVGRTDFDIFDDSHARPAFEDEQEIIRTGQPIIAKEEREDYKDGHVAWVSSTKMPMRDADGKIVGIMGISRDITDRKQAEEALRRSQEEFKDLFDNAPVGFHELDAEGRLIRINNTELKMLGYTAKELLGQFVWKLSMDEAMSRRATLAKLAGEQTSAQGYERLFRRKDGSTVPLMVNDRLIKNADGVVTGIHSTIEDITARKRAEKSLAERTAELARERLFLRTLLDTLPDNIFAKDAQSRFTLVNTACAGQLGAGSVEAVTGKTDADFVSPELASQYLADEKELMRSGEPVTKEEVFQHKGTGEMRWSLTTKVPLKDDAGKVVGLIGIARDITGRKAAEAAMKASEERLRDLNMLQGLLLAPNPVAKKCRLVTDAVGHIVGADFARIWLIKPGDRCATGCVHAQVTEGPHVCRFRDRCLHLLASSGRYTHTDGGNHARVPFGCYKIGKIAAGEESGFLTNEAATDPRVHNHEWAKELGLVSFAGYRLTDTDGSPIGVLALFGRKAITAEQDLLLKGIAHITSQMMLAARAEDTLRESEARFRRVFEEGTTGMVMVDEQFRFIQVNPAFASMLGYSVEELQTMSFLDITHPDNVPQDVGQIRSLLCGEISEYRAEKRYLAKSGKDVWGQVYAGVVRNADGQFHYLLAIIANITERKAAEAQLQKAMADLERSNKELEQFAYVASHDLQEPLRMVSSYTQLLAKRFEGQLDEKTQKYVHYAVDGAGRMQSLINDLLAYSRVGRRGKPLEPADSHAILGEAVRNLAARIEETHAVITNGDLPVVRADASQLVLVFQNLISNAIKFRREGIPAVHVSAQDKGGEWLFAVKDNGIGIEARHADRVFEIFQRLHTREEYPGTGIGLSVCKRVVERHGGKIWFESEPGNGTTFFFTIPK